MVSLSRKWIGALLLPLTVTAWAAESQTSASTPTAAEPASAEHAAATSRAGAFDLRGAKLREIVRAAASTQMGSDYSVEPAKPVDTDALLAQTLRQDREAPKKKPAKPRLPDCPPPCDGLISCGLDTLLGLDDFDEQLYAQAESNRLMYQGSFTDRSSINAGVSLPLSHAAVQVAGALLRP